MFSHFMKCSQISVIFLNEEVIFISSAKDAFNILFKGLFHLSFQKLDSESESKLRKLTKQKSTSGTTCVSG